MVSKYTYALYQLHHIELLVAMGKVTHGGTTTPEKRALHSILCKLGIPIKSLQCPSNSVLAQPDSYVPKNIYNKYHYCQGYSAHHAAIIIKQIPHIISNWNVHMPV
jgi:hypothetical protein